MKIWLNPSCPFDLDVTLCCGQVFRWDKHGEWWYGVVEGKVLKVRQIGNELEFENADVDFVKNYFGLNDDLPYILSKISKDEHMKQAVEIFKGLRIIRQNPWECLVSYICATYKNISAIKQILFNLSKKFGEEIRFEGQKFYTFPTPERLAKAATQELAHCGLGYRVNYVAETAKLVHKNHFDFESLRKMSYEEAKNELLKFKGVGLKVADCVLLFALGKLEAFPVDVWIKRVILKYYANHFPKEFVRKISGKKSLSKTEYKELNLFGRKYFGEYAGYAQEYLYHYERTRV
ncbi:MAG: DNA glycosylase [Candidatus Bathyarchaeia archaeon]|nr:DNA glycosylase [Candidatus Bathyarchaeia archaeon]